MDSSILPPPFLEDWMNEMMLSLSIFMETMKKSPKSSKNGGGRMDESIIFKQERKVLLWDFRSQQKFHIDNMKKMHTGHFLAVMRSIITFALLSPLFYKGVEGQAKAGLWEQMKNDPEKNLSAPTLNDNGQLEQDFPDGSRTAFLWWLNGDGDAGSPDVYENLMMDVVTDNMMLAAPIWGNPTFFCIDIPRMLYEAYIVGDSNNIHQDAPIRSKAADKFNEEGIGWKTQPRSKSRFTNAYSLFWIMEPTSHRWNRRFVFRINAAQHLQKRPDDIETTSREKIYIGFPGQGNFVQQPPYILHLSLDPYTDVTDGQRVRDDFRWSRVMELERRRVENEGLYWNVEVTGVRDLNTTKILKGWYHLKITLRKTTFGSVPVPLSSYIIDRLAVTARGLTVHHQMRNTGYNGLHKTYNSIVSQYFAPGETGSGSHRLHKVWEGGAGAFVHDFPKCRGVRGHNFVEKQFVPCGTTGKSQWYYGNNFIYVKTDYPEYPGTTDVYGGGVVLSTNGNAEEIHLNYKLDQSFCNMYLALDFVVNGVVISANKFSTVHTMTPNKWIQDGRDFSFAVERSSSTRISFVVDDYVDPPELLPGSCTSSQTPWRKYAPPIIKSGDLPQLTFYENADPIPPGVNELDCFVPLKKFDPSLNPNVKQPPESFDGAIQETLPAETFSSPNPRGLTLSYWYLFTHSVGPIPPSYCIPDERGNCQVFAEFSHLIRDQVKEWDWRVNDPSDFRQEIGTKDFRVEKTQLPYLDSTLKAPWISYFDWIKGTDELNPIYSNTILNDWIIRLGSERAWPNSRQEGTADQVFNDPTEWDDKSSYFQHLFFKGIPFMGRASSDKSQFNFGSIVPTRPQKHSVDRRFSYTGEPGHSPPACDLYVSRHRLRILDPDDDEEYHKAIGPPNNPADTCNSMASILTTDPALQYIRKAYVKPRKQTVGGIEPRRTWYEKYIQFDWGQYCANRRGSTILKDGCPTMPPRPYTTPPAGFVPNITEDPIKSVIFKPRPGKLNRREASFRGYTFDNPVTLYIWDSRVIHGIWMTVLTIFIMPVSSFLVRFYEESWEHKRLKHAVSFAKDEIWYLPHTINSIAILLVMGVGLSRQFFTIYVLGRNYSMVAGFHRRMGYAVVAISLGMMVISSFQWKNKNCTTVFMFLHWFAGNVVYLLLLLCMVSSVFIPGSPSSYFDYATYEPTADAVRLEVILWLLVTWIIFDILVVLTVTFCWGQRVMGSMIGLDPLRLYHPSPVPVASLHHGYDHPVQRKHGGAGLRRAFVAISIIITYSICQLLILITPFTVPLRGLGWMSCTHYPDGTVRESFPRDCPVVGRYVQFFLRKVF